MIASPATKPRAKFQTSLVYAERESQKGLDFTAGEEQVSDPRYGFAA